MLVAERNGRVRLIQNDALVAEPVWSAEGVAAGNELKWLALHPSFAYGTGSCIFLIRKPASAARRSPSRAAVSTGAEAQRCRARSSSPTPGRPSGNLAGQMLFGPDETLYVTVGDRDRPLLHGHRRQQPAHEGAGARATTSARLCASRTTAACRADNPFVGKAGAKPEIFTYGHRNGYGLAFNPQTRRALAGRDRPDGRRRGQHPACRATTTAGRSCRWAATTPARSSPIKPYSRRRHGQPADVLGAVDQPVEHRCSTRASKFPQWTNNMLVGSLTTARAAARRVRPAVAGGAARAVASAAEPPHPRRAADARRLSSTSRRSASSAAPRLTARFCASSRSRILARASTGTPSACFSAASSCSSFGDARLRAPRARSAAVPALRHLPPRAGFLGGLDRAAEQVRVRRDPCDAARAVARATNGPSAACHQRLERGFGLGRVHELVQPAHCAP